MKTMKQLLRQPLKTVIGIVFMTLAAAIVCLCVGQAVAAQATKEDLDRRFSTVAIPLSDEYAAVQVRIREELLTWMETVAEEHPDIVKQVTNHGILSAYIPELTPLNITSEKYDGNEGGNYNLQSDPYNAPYSTAMLVITLEEVGEPQASTYTTPAGKKLTAADFLTYSEYLEWLFDPEVERVSAASGYTQELVGTVTGVVSLQSGYRDPVGRVARLTLSAATLEELAAYDLEPGQQYIVYGMDYVDEYWKLIGEVNHDGQYDHWSFWPYDPSLVRLITEQEMERFKEWAERYPNDEFLTSRLSWYAEYNGSVYLTKEQYKRLNAISLTLEHPLSTIQYEEIRDELTGELIELKPKGEVTYTDANGNAVTLTNEEFTQRYSVPTITKLDGSVEDFLASAAGTAWQQAVDQAAVSNQAFAVIGVDKLGYLAEFAQQESLLVAGRDFTQEELEGGARVCILYEALAYANGLQVGDTITLNLYATDFGLPYQGTAAKNRGLVNPSASFYSVNSSIAETAEYTIIGLCLGKSVFADVGESEYALSANTVFVPRASVATPMETRPSVVFYTMVLENGKINAFHELVLASGYGGCFRYNDQDYSNIAANFHNYQVLGRQVLTVGVVIYVVLLALFLLLYPASQKKNVRTMQSLGARFPRRLGTVLLSAMGIVVPASALGGVIGSLLWDETVAALQTTAESAVALELEPQALAMVALAQMLFALVLSLGVAVFVAAPRGMSARR